MEKVGIDYDVISDTDFEKAIGLNNAKLIIFHNHSEYWSYEGIGVLKQMIDKGVSILFLSGNNMYREVEVVENDALVVMDQKTPRSAVEEIVGTYYSESGYNLPCSSFRVIDEKHWIFEDTNLKIGDRFGGDLVSCIETDKLGPYSKGFKLLAIGNNNSGPAHFVIKEYENGNFIVNTSSVSSTRALATDKVWSHIVLNIISKGMGVRTERPDHAS